jgi:hypothetical protein
MSCFSCPRVGLAAFAKAAAKSAAARLRRLGALPTHPDWPRRAEVCERCPLRGIRDQISYCGTPFLGKIVREPAMDGCGCPTIEKAKSQLEHCPLTPLNRPSIMGKGKGQERCDCKWCAGSNHL